tara:strand:+ start:531 stop:1463 length:933 start_codon:yes stop_codon:yes gene_type:complete
LSNVLLAGTGGALRDVYLHVPARDGSAVSCESGGIAIVGQNDMVVPYLSSRLDNFYPLAVARALLRKDLLPDLLAAHGFRKLHFVRVRRASDLRGMTDFMMKPVLGSGSTAWVRDACGIAYRKFRDEAQFLDFVGGKDLSAALRNGYIAQSAVMSDSHYTSAIGGTVNGCGDVLFVRTATTLWLSGFRSSTVWTYSTPEIDAAKILLRNFIGTVGIRNAAFSLQLIKKDGHLYPMDWNFHIAAAYIFDALRTQPEEFHSVIHHMMDVTVDKFKEPSDVWLVERKERNMAPSQSEYSKNNISKANSANPAS